MPRATPSELLTELRAEGIQPVELVHVETGLASDIRLANYDGDLVWAGETWLSRAFSVPGVAMQAHGESSSSSLEVEDVDNSWLKSFLDQAVDFRGKSVRYYITTLERIEAGASIASSILYDLIVDSVHQPDGRAIFELVDMTSLFRIKVPLGMMTRTEFPGLPTGNTA